MIIKMLPQVRDDRKIWYDVEKDKLTITINDVTDTFDFTNVPDGELKLVDDETGESLVNTVLDENPIRVARKQDGELYVETIFTIRPTETDERLLFPEPMAHEAFNELMEELAERDKPEEDESVDDDIIVEDERVDEEELVYKDDYIIDLEEVDF